MGLMVEVVGSYQGTPSGVPISPAWKLGFSGQRLKPVSQAVGSAWLKP